jgi:hypothetical protein
MRRQDTAIPELPVGLLDDLRLRASPSEDCVHTQFMTGGTIRTKGLLNSLRVADEFQLFLL